MADTELISHELPRSGAVSGALAITTVLGAMAVGPVSPVACAALFGLGRPRAAALLLGAIVASYSVRRYSPRFCRFYLGAAGWFASVTLHVERAVVAAFEQDDGSMWCYHPHGTSVGFGLSLNGAVRFKAARPALYVPAAIAEQVNPARLAKGSGVQAQVLFQIPFLCAVLRAFGAATPATKAGMLSLLRARSDFGILPGGMEEVALYARGRERVYLRRRAGFIKYALQHGYLLLLAYTFGECDVYNSLRAGAAARMAIVKKYGFVVPIFWGDCWWCPWLPRRDVPIHTVLGEPLQLPRITEPTDEEVAHWHAQYIERLTALFDRHKARFGYADRELEIF